MPPTYEIVKDGNAIKCLGCEMTSHHPEDVRQRYCGNCHVFHDDFAKREGLLLTSEKPPPGGYPRLMTPGTPGIHPIYSDTYLRRVEDEVPD